MRSSFFDSVTNNFRESAVEWFIYSSLAMTGLFSQFFDSRGFSPVELGVLMAVTPLITIFSNPFWIQLSEKIGRRKVIYLVSISGAVLVWAVFFFEGFVPKLFSLAASAFFLSAVVPIAESGVINSLIKKGGRFDHSRLWGTVGYSLVSLVGGILVNFGFYYIFIICSFSVVMVVISGRKLFEDKEQEKAEQELTGQKAPWGFFLFMLIPATLGVAVVSFCSVFLPVLIRVREYPAAAVGLSFAVLSISEIPFLFFAEKILKKTGILFLLVTGLFAIGLRTVLMPLSSSVTSLVLVQAIHGWNYIVLYYSVFNFIHFYFPKNLHGKALSLFWMMMSGVSFFSGSVLGGFFVENWGLENSYSNLGIFTMGLSVFVFVLSFFIRKRTF